MSTAKPLNQRLIQEVESKSQQANEIILPQSNQITLALSEFYKTEIQSTSMFQIDFTRVENDLINVIDDYKSKYEECKSNVDEIDKESAKIDQFSNTGKGFLNAKSEEIKSKAKNIDAVGTGIKETVSKVKPAKLADLPVEKDKTLKDIFSTLFAVLYKEKKSEFKWKQFQKLALKHQDGEDFLFRLVNINFKQLNTEHGELLLILKNDPQFQNACLNSKYAYQIIDIADWVEYVCVGSKFSQEKMRAEKEYEKIRLDMSKKSKGTLKKSKQFWSEAAKELDTFQNNLINLESEIKTLKIGAQSSLETINENSQWVSDQINKINSMVL